MAKLFARAATALTDRLVVEVIKPYDILEMIFSSWQLKPTVVDPGRLQAAVAAIVKVLSAAQMEYAARRRRGR